MFTITSNLGITNTENSVPFKSAKAVNSKPKGLSLRSESDGNICTSKHKQNLESQKKDSFLKVVRERQKSGHSPVSKSPHSVFGKKKLGEEFTFKKPNAALLPTRKKIYKASEQTIGYYDQETSFNQNLHNVGLDKEFTAFVSSRLYVKPYEDECISDAETVEIPPVADLQLVDNSASSRRSSGSFCEPEIPPL